MLLLFTAAIVLNIESVQQTLNLTLNAAYLHLFVPVEALIWIRSFAIVLLIVAHAMRHVEVKKQTQQESPASQITPELLAELRQLLTQTTVTEEANNQLLLLSQGEQDTNSAPEAATDSEDDQGANNGERVKAYITLHPEAKVREVAEALSISVSTANK